MVLWSVFESVLELSIVREAKLAPLPGVIITSGLGVERKASIARSLLALRDDSAKAISLINKILQRASRNALVHGEIHIAYNAVVFKKRETNQSLKIRETILSAPDFIKLVQEVSEVLGELQAELRIPDDALIEHSEIVKSLVNKLPGSGKPLSKGHSQ
jgi:hypothetical protein